MIGEGLPSLGKLQSLMEAVSCPTSSTVGYAACKIMNASSAPNNICTMIIRNSS
jgi:hypothetical protein